jgi:predicted protein tyrosine phosphatase
MKNEGENQMSDQFLMNRLANCGNKYQGRYKRVLCLCSAGLLRSPTAAWVLSQEPYNFNTRAAGLVPEFALIPVDDVLLNWADEIVVMDSKQAEQVRLLLGGLETPIVVLGIPDNFAYRDPALIDAIRRSYDIHTEKLSE